MKISALTTRPWAANRAAMRILSAACLLFCAPVIGQAQSDSGATQSLPNVTVTAPRPPTAQQLAGPSVPHFIAHHAALSVALGQLTRWRTPVCPVVSGLSPGFNEFIATRLRAIAASAGAPVASDSHCRVNIEILFTTQPQVAMDAIAKAYPDMLGMHYHSQMTCAPGSRLSTECTSEIVNVFIVADTGKVAGYPVGSISDYVAVVALSMVQSLDVCDPLPSILDLMSPSCRSHDKPDAITAGDLALLKALYRADLKLVPDLEKGSIQAQMMSEFRSEH